MWSAGRERAGYGWRGVCAGVCGAGRSALGCARGGHADRIAARHPAGHIARAALEAIAFQVADVLEAVHSETGTPLAALRVDGGASVNDLLMQFQADVLGVPVVRPQVTETTALGAAYLAGLATDSGGPECCGPAEGDTRFEPQMDAADRKARRGQWQRAWSG